MTHSSNARHTSSSAIRSALLLAFLTMSTRAEASSGRGKALDDLCQKFFMMLGFSQGTAEVLSGLSAFLFLAATCYIIYRQNRSAPPDE